MSIVKAILNGKVLNWDSHVISREKEIVVFTSPGLRVKHVRKYYWTVRRMYPDLQEEAVDAAFEAYVLGFIMAPDVISFARRYHGAISGQGSASDPSLGYHETTGHLFNS